MISENTQTSADQVRHSLTFKQAKGIIDTIHRTWQQIRHRISSLMEGKIDAVIFWLDPGSKTNQYEESCRQRVCDVIREQFGDSPAELLMLTSPDKREQTVMEFHATITSALGFPASSVVSCSMPGTCGVYLWPHDALIVNSDNLEKQPLTLEEAKEILDTVSHETYHSFQRKAIVRPSHFNVPKAGAQIWRINFSNYIRPEQNPERYWTQPVEVSARLFAGYAVNHFYS